VRFLLDTHFVLWSQGETRRVPAAASAAINDPDNQPIYSVVTLWEIAIKNARVRADFRVDARRLRTQLGLLSWEELPVTGAHALAVGDLPPLHKDPFDRLLIAQAKVEGIAFMTADARLAAYGYPVQAV
jgi:PIN domain nuclease of toxin-antitoxin system